MVPQGRRPGVANAQFNLGAMYFNGQGVPQDYAQALKWYRKAADQGFAGAQNNLGALYANGQGVPQDYARGREWYRKAADQGYAAAQNNLGVAVRQWPRRAAGLCAGREWYRKAADQGFAAAQNNLRALGLGRILGLDVTFCHTEQCNEFSGYVNVYSIAELCAENNIIFDRDVVHAMAAFIKTKFNVGLTQTQKDQIWASTQRRLASQPLKQSDCTELPPWIRLLFPQEVFTPNGVPRNPF